MKQLLKKSARLFGWFVLSLYLLIALLPKEQLYYLLEEKLEPLQLYINHETPSDALVVFSIKDGTLLYQDIEAASFEKISLTTLLFYNSIRVAPLSFTDDLAAFVPKNVESVTLTHTLLAPHLITVAASGDFGEATGEVNLVDRHIRIDFVFDPVMNRNHAALLQMLKRGKEGYYYEQSF